MDRKEKAIEKVRITVGFTHTGPSKRPRLSDVEKDVADWHRRISTQKKSKSPSSQKVGVKKVLAKKYFWKL